LLYFLITRTKNQYKILTLIMTLLLTLPLVRLITNILASGSFTGWTQGSYRLTHFAITYIYTAYSDRNMCTQD